MITPKPPPLPASSWRMPGQSILLMACVAVTIALASGCEPVLFPKNVPRTQFENYDRMRGEAAPETQMDPLGHQEPALRARLAPQ
jgi:hypothetical protein